MLKRALQRLPTISKATAYEYEDDRLRAIAIAQLLPNTPVADGDEALHFEIITRTDTALILLLSGKPTAAEGAIAHFRQQQQLKDVVMSAITV